MNRSAGKFLSALNRMRIDFSFRAIIFALSMGLLLLSGAAQAHRLPDNVPLAFSEMTVGEFRERLLREPFKSRWENHLRIADSMADSGAGDSVAGLGRARHSKGVLEVCSLAYVITGKPEYYEAAKREAWAILELERWYEPKVWNRGAELPTAELSLGVGRFWGWCGHRLDEGERAWFVERAVKLGIEPYLASVEEYEDWWVNNPVTNWCGVCHGGCGLLGLALAEESPLARRAAELAWEHLQTFTDNALLVDGAGHEGVMYHRYGMRFSFMFITAWEAATGDELPFRTADRLSGYWDVYMQDPGLTYANFNNMGESVFDGLYGESSRHLEGGPNAGLNALFEARTPGGDPLLLWAADYGGGNVFASGASVNWLLWRRDVPPASERPPLQDAVLFRGAGHAILRNDRMWLAFNGGWTSDKSHNNRDVGTFVLTVEGERFVHDPGYGVAETKDHSTLTVNGQDAQKGESEGKFMAFEKVPHLGLTYLVNDMSKVYARHVSSVIRTVVFMENYVVVLDDVRGDKAASVDWRLQTRKAIELDGREATLPGQVSDLEVRMLAPEGVEFTVGKTGNGLRHLSAVAELESAGGTGALAFVVVLFAGDAPELAWEGGTLGLQRLTVAGQTFYFERTDGGWLPREINGEKLPEPNTPSERNLVRVR